MGITAPINNSAPDEALLLLVPGLILLGAFSLAPRRYPDLRQRLINDRAFVGFVPLCLLCGGAWYGVGFFFLFFFAL